MSTVAIRVGQAREAERLLQAELELVAEIRSRQTRILELTLDWGVLAPIRRAMGEFDEDTGNAGTLVGALADHAWAADNSSVPPYAVAGLLAAVESAAARLRAGLTDGVGSGATAAEIEAYLATAVGGVHPARALVLGDSDDFDLADAFVGGRYFPDGSQWHQAVNGHDPDSGIDHVGGGALLGPDGRYYPLVVTILTDDDGHRWTAGFQEPGWTEIGHVTGTTQFHDGLSDFQRVIVGAGVATGLDIPRVTDDDALVGLLYQRGFPPVLTELPESYDALDFPSTSDIGAVGAGVELAVGAVQGFTTFRNVGRNVDRAYEVSFQQHDGGAIRATLTTHTLSVDDDGDIHLTADQIYVTEQNELAQVPAAYLPPDGASFTAGGVTSGPSAPVRDPGEIRTRPLRVGQGPIEIGTDHLPD